MTIAEQIIKLIESSIDDFNAGIPEIQKQLYSDLVKELQKLSTKEGKILADVANLKLIGNIRNKLEKIILNEQYIKQVENYVKAFDLVTALQVEYFKDFNTNFRPAKTLAIIRQTSIEATLNSLTESGINANVLDPVHDLLRVHITSGGNYPDLLGDLQNRIMGNEKELGGLMKYSKQITTDALNQYSANYQKTVAEDLGLEWFRYVGSNLTTTRQFCEWLTKKEYFHISELPEIIRGRIDGHTCAIYKKTGLPYGMNPVTNVSNFQTLRGGFNCGHQAFAVPTIAVPAALLAELPIR